MRGDASFSECLREHLIWDTRDAGTDQSAHEDRQDYCWSPGRDSSSNLAYPFPYKILVQ